jgi:predicted component of type VI protein secretion system
VVSARGFQPAALGPLWAHESERHVQAKLVVVGGEDASRQFELRLPTIIGRSRSTDVTLGHPLISRHHCEIFEVSGRLMLRDLGSLNGTYVGETRLSSEPIALEPGEKFSLGPVTLQAEYCAAEDDADESSSAAGWQPGRPTVDSPMQDEDAPDSAASRSRRGARD